MPRARQRRGLRAHDEAQVEQVAIGSGGHADSGDGSLRGVGFAGGGVTGVSVIIWGVDITSSACGVSVTDWGVGIPSLACGLSATAG